MEAILTQLKQRQVFKVATIYAVSAWPLIQVADLAVPALGLPDSVMTLLLQIFLIGFPITLIFAWIFNFTATGIVRAESDQEITGDNAQVNVHTTLVVVGTLIIALLAVLGSQFLMQTAEVNTSKITPLVQTVPSTPVTDNVIKPTVSKKESIAVLPFVPFSQDPADEFFADGMVEELLNLLAKIPDLQVSARTSSFAYKNVSNKTIVQIGQELGVDTILEGSIRKNDVTNQVRITAQLIKVSTGEHLWSETFDREYRDVFQIQDDIARAVVDKMKVTLLGEEETMSFKAETTSVDAMIAFGKGQQELAHRTVASLNKALTHFEQAVKADSEYARAYVGVADANILLALYGNTPMAAAKENAQQALDKALLLNNKLGAAYASLGLLWSKQDNQLAEQHFKQAMALNPNYAFTYMWYGALLQGRGDVEQSHLLFKRAFELNPKSPIAAFNVASGYYELGDEAKAMELFSHIIRNDPYYPSAYNLVGDILSNRGRLDEAINMHKRALDVDGTNKGALSALLILSMYIGDYIATNSWFDYINQQAPLFSEAEIYQLQARFYAVQGKPEQAIQTLARVKYPPDHINLNKLIQAEVAYYREQYVQAIEYYEELRSNQPDDKSFYEMSDGQVATHLAYSYQQLEKTALAEQITADYLTFLQQEKTAKNNDPGYYFTVASIKAVQGKSEEVLYYLQAAIDAGWVSLWQAETEPALAYIIKDQQFVQMIGGVKAKLANMKRRLNNEESFLLADNDSFESFQ